MFFYQGQSCPVCQKPFQPEEDIVSCPHCGAPHHRDCWKQQGGCHFAADHGTPRQWKKEDAQPRTEGKHLCPRCGSENTEFAEFCARCGAELPHQEWQSQPQAQTPPRPSGYGSYTPFTGPHFDPMGGVSPDQPLEDATAGELQPLITVNSQYYLPRFARMCKHNKSASWNWAAFFLPSSWLLYRKNMLAGIAVLLFFMFEQVANMYIVTQCLGYIFHAGLSMAQMQASIAHALQSGDAIYFYILFALSAIQLAVRILCGLFGNRIYFDTLCKKARRLRQDPDHRPEPSSPAAGGVSLFLGALSYMILWFLDVMVNYL